jgi:hypothetical protein
MIKKVLYLEANGPGRIRGEQAAAAHGDKDSPEALLLDKSKRNMPNLHSIPSSILALSGSLSR